MKKFVLSLVGLLFTIYSYGQTISAYTPDDILKRASSKDSIYIINFWATWCGPCVKEIHIFNELDEKYKGKPVKILLVSLDFKKDYQDKIEKFIKKKKMTPEIVWCNTNYANELVPKIDDSWQGSIPATLVLQPGQYFRQFWEGTVTAKQVSNVVDKQLTFFN